MFKGLVTPQGHIRYLEVFKVFFLVMPAVALYSLLGASTRQFEVLHGILYVLLMFMIMIHVAYDLIKNGKALVNWFIKWLKQLLTRYEQVPYSEIRERKTILLISFTSIINRSLSYGVIRC